jgi:hypothetical protein
MDRLRGASVVRRAAARLTGSATQTLNPHSIASGRSYRWNVLAVDGRSNEGLASAWASFSVDSAAQAPAIIIPANYRHLSCVAQIILRWEAPQDPNGIFGCQVTLQEVLGVGYGDPGVFGWMAAAKYDATGQTECNRDYRWRVLASDQLQSQSPWSEWAYFIIDPPGR